MRTCSRSPSTAGRPHVRPVDRARGRTKGADGGGASKLREEDTRARRRRVAEGAGAPGRALRPRPSGVASASTSDSSAVPRQVRSSGRVRLVAVRDRGGAEHLVAARRGAPPRSAGGRRLVGIATAPWPLTTLRWRLSDAAVDAERGNVRDRNRKRDRRGRGVLVSALGGCHRRRAPVSGASPRPAIATAARPPRQLARRGGGGRARWPGGLGRGPARRVRRRHFRDVNGQLHATRAAGGPS